MRPYEVFISSSHCKQPPCISFFPLHSYAVSEPSQGLTVRCYSCHYQVHLPWTTWTFNFKTMKPFHIQLKAWTGHYISHVVILRTRVWRPEYRPKALWAIFAKENLWRCFLGRLLRRSQTLLLLPSDALTLSETHLNVMSRQQ